MTGDPDLDRLHDELTSMGLVVAPFSDGLEVRRSTFESIRVRIADGRLVCSAWFGRVPRARAVVTLCVVAAAVVMSTFASQGSSPRALVVAFVVVCSLMYAGVRYTITDRMIAEIRDAWLSLRSRGAVSAMGGDPAGPSAPALGGLEASGVRIEREAPAPAEIERRDSRSDDRSP